MTRCPSCGQNVPFPLAGLPLAGVRPATGVCLETKHLLAHQFQKTHSHSQSGGLRLSIHHPSSELMNHVAGIRRKVPRLTSDRGTKGK